MTEQPQLPDSIGPQSGPDSNLSNSTTPTFAAETAGEMARIFVVEDEVIISKDIQRSLKRLGYQVVGSAVSGAAALEGIAQNHPDLILMDIHIKGERDGIETAGDVTARFDLPVIYLTAFADPPTIERAKRSGPFGYLLKPFEERELGTAIEMALYKHGAERRLKRSEERLSRAIEASADALLITDAEGKIVLTNAAAERVFGVPRAGLMARTHDDLAWDARDLEGKVLAPERLPVALAQAASEPVYAVEYSARHASGRRLILSVNAAPLCDAREQFDGVVLSITDITERKALEERILHQALHDPLTGLPNRTLFLNRLEHALSRSGRNPSPLAVLFIDLDNFKWVNDSLGHAAGDQLLRQVSERLQKALRAGDSVSRFGGDEFTVLIDHVENPRYAITVAERIVAALQEAFTLDGQAVFTSPSIGIAFGHNNESADELLRCADTAMYAAKKRGRACYEVFRDGLSDAARFRLETGNDLRLALERDELVLHYQPKIDLQSGGIYGFEALVRWNHPVRGLVSPADFIPIAEEMGLIVPIGRWVLREACRQAKIWTQVTTEPLSMSINVSARQLHEVTGTAREEALEIPLDAARDMQINVNLSARQLQHPNLVAEVAQVLQETGLNPGALVLEITETTLMDDGEETVRVLQNLKSLGVRLAIDDFGTGYSSLAYLKSFPLDFLKIDRQFVLGMREEGDTVILSSMISLAHALNLTVVAEGAETAEEVGRLRSLGCDLAQGFFFARPMAPGAVQTFLDDSPGDIGAI